MNPLRNPNINYCRGWFFVTFQVAQNKSVFGVIADRQLTLNALGSAVRENLLDLGTVFRELDIDTAMVMPNHVHVVLKIESSKEGHDLAYFIGRFKSFTTHLYLEMLKTGACVDIGPRLWQTNFYDNLVSDHQELINCRNYTLKNPERWENDRFGPVTQYAIGNAELLSERLVAFVASDTRDNWGAEKPHLREFREWFGREAIGSDAPLVSTYSSFEEQGALARRLDAKKPFVWVDPAGIKARLPLAVVKACEEGWGLVISPVPGGTGLNKQRAIWCNRWVLKVSERIYVGTIKRGGTLESLLAKFGPGGPNPRECGPGGPNPRECGPGGPNPRECGPGGPNPRECGPGGPNPRECGHGGPNPRECGPGGFSPLESRRGGLIS